MQSLQDSLVNSWVWTSLVNPLCRAMGQSQHNCTTSSCRWLTSAQMSSRTSMCTSWRMDWNSGTLHFSMLHPHPQTYLNFLTTCLHYCVMSAFDTAYLRINNLFIDRKIRYQRRRLEHLQSTVRSMAVQWQTMQCCIHPWRNYTPPEFVITILCQSPFNTIHKNMHLPPTAPPYSVSIP